MSILLIILFIILGIVAVFLLLAVLMPKNMRVEQSILIEKPVQDVFDFVKHTKNQDQFSEWNMTDPAMKKTYQGTDGEVGFVYTWDSQDKNVGAGSQETKQIQQGKQIVFELRFTRPMASVAQGTMITESTSANQTRFTWRFEGPMKFPMNAMMPIMKNVLGSSMGRSVANLKKVLEKN